MTATATPTPPSKAGRLILALTAAGLAAIFIGSFLARLDGPSLVHQRQQQPQAMPGQMPPEGMGQAIKGQMPGQTPGQMPPEGMGQAMPGGVPQMSQEGQMALMGLMQKLQEDPNDLTTLRAIAEQFMLQGDFVRAESFLSRAMVSSPTDTETLNLLGVALFKQERYEEAAAQFDTILELSPGNGRAHFNLGILKTHFLGLDGSVHFRAAVADPELPEHLREEAANELAAHPGDEAASPAHSGG